MATPAEYYRSLPPVSKVYGVACLLTTTAYYLQLYRPWNIALSYELVFKRFQVWRLVTNFFFLGPFSFSFAFRLLIIARYGVALERWSFDERTADYVWMLIFGALSLLVMAIVPYLWSRFMGASLVFMIFYVWGCEFPNAQINFYGLVSFKSKLTFYPSILHAGFLSSWIYLAVDLLLGNPLKPDILGMVAGHLYYFLTVLHPLAGGKDILKTPLWVTAGSKCRSVFSGTSYRLNGNQRRSPSEAETSTPMQQTDQNSGVSFREKAIVLEAVSLFLFCVVSNNGLITMHPD
ncbi:hypothetical protein AAG906_031229 [Vitis piasezkii]